MKHETFLFTRLSAVITLAAAVVLTGCQSSKDHTPKNNAPARLQNATPADTYPALPPANDRVRLREGQTVAVPSAPFAIKFEQVTADDRCALTGQCIWAGNVTARLQLIPNQTNANVATKTVDLSMGDLREGLKLDRDVVFAGYDVALDAVYPTPTSGDAFEQLRGKYLIDLKVTKANAKK